jgi:hypothetical protein
MKKIAGILAASLLLTITLAAQQGGLQDPLLDRFVGSWVPSGTIDGKQTTHDVEARWVLDHQYLQFHEVSREKDAKGHPAYEAIVFIGWDAASGQYACLWLDSTGGGGLAAQAIGHARREAQKMAFLFKGGDGSLFHTTFRYDEAAGTWQWLMDAEADGKLQSFARVTLKKK